MEDYLSQLNIQQREAVQYCDGPQLVIAGAGSGKTRVLTYKIVHLLANEYEPWRILALTFTNKAAREMRQRIEALVGPKTAQKLWMGTFHSIFAKILRRNAELIGFKSNFTIYDASDSKSLIKSIIKDMDLDDKIYKPNVVASIISTAKNALVGPEAYANDRNLREADRHARRDRLYEIYAAYMRRCHIAGAMDFDDLLYFTNILLRDNPDVKRHYQEFFRYVLVDEYQDTNFAQHLIVSQICENSQKLCVVGDDAQSIYSFRGANIRNILNLNKAYPNLQIFKLEQNYRSTQNIINAANTLIEKNRQQIPKQVFSKNAQGDRIEVVKCYSDYEEAGLVANRIMQRRQLTADQFDEFAILYRTNAQSRVFEESLRKLNIPYRIYGGTAFYQRKEVKDAIAYFRLSINPNDDEALRRVINYPARGIGETTLRKLSMAATSNGVSVWDVVQDPAKYEVSVNKGTCNRLTEFARLIESFIDMNARGCDAYETAKFIMSETRLISVLISERTPENISKQENLEELLNGVQEFVTEQTESGNDDSIFMGDFLSLVSLATDQDEESSADIPKVTLMTIHAAKGLEFGNIFIVGVEEDLLPSAMSNSNPMEIEEERRLLYVAITRAKRFCMISYAASRFRNGATMNTKPSRFIGDIDSRYLDFKLGTDRSSSVVDPVSRYRESFHSSTTFRSFGPEKNATVSTRTNTYSRGTSSIPFVSAALNNIPSSSTDDEYSKHDVSELSEGMKIRHSRFGEGRIVSIDTSQPDAKILVQFDNVEVKVLLLKFAKFNIVDQ